MEENLFKLFNRRTESYDGVKAVNVSECSNTIKIPKIMPTGAPSKWVKYSSLVCLTVQNVVLTISMRHSRVRQKEQYLATTAVVMVELLKLICCLIVIFIQEKSSFKGFCKSIYNNIFLQPMDCLKISVPGFVYMVQNNLLYLAITHLETSTFQVCYQLKILTTAIFSVSMLGRKLTRTQWLSLVVLFLGVSIIVHLQSSEQTPPSTTLHKTSPNLVAGFAAVFTSCILSGFAGVYFEKLLKSSPQTLYVRNVQLSLFGLVTGLVAVLMLDREAVLRQGFFFGYDNLVFFIIVLQSLGGLMVAVVVKYADNILKGFATSFAILLSFAASIAFFDFQPSLTFSFGTSLVLVSLYLYNAGVSFPVVYKSLQNV